MIRISEVFRAGEFWQADSFQHMIGFVNFFFEQTLVEVLVKIFIHLDYCWLFIRVFSLFHIINLLIFSYNQESVVFPSLLKILPVFPGKSKYLEISLD